MDKRRNWSGRTQAENVDLQERLRIMTAGFVDVQDQRDKLNVQLAALRERAEKAEEENKILRLVSIKGSEFQLAQEVVSARAERDALARENAALREAAEKVVRYIDEEICWSHAFHEYDDDRGVCLECKERKEIIASLDAALRSDEGEGRK